MNYGLDRLSPDGPVGIWPAQSWIDLYDVICDSGLTDAPGNSWGRFTEIVGYIPVATWDITDLKSTRNVFDEKRGKRRGEDGIKCYLQLFRPQTTDQQTTMNNKKICGNENVTHQLVHFLWSTTKMIDRNFTIGIAKAYYSFLGIRIFLVPRCTNLSC